MDWYVYSWLGEQLQRMERLSCIYIPSCIKPMTPARTTQRNSEVNKVHAAAMSHTGLLLQMLSLSFWDVKKYKGRCHVRLYLLIKQRTWKHCWSERVLAFKSALKSLTKCCIIFTPNILVWYKPGISGWWWWNISLTPKIFALFFKHLEMCCPHK